jgi:hypothetical protein
MGNLQKYNPAHPELYVYSELEEKELIKGVFTALLVLTLLLAGYFSWNEFRYYFFSRTYSATIIKVYKESSAQNKNFYPQLHIRYEFKVDNKLESAGLALPIDTPYAVGNKIEVQYLPVKYLQNSRIKGTGHTTPVIIFLISILLLTFQLILLVRQSKQPFRKSVARS